MKKWVAATCVAAGLLASAAGAQAATIVSTFSGKVLSGTDTAGDFGGGSLSGQLFDLTLTWDDTLGVAAPGQLQGVAFLGQSIPLTGISLDVGGLSYNEAVNVFIAGLGAYVRYDPTTLAPYQFGGSASVFGSTNNFSIALDGTAGPGSSLTYDANSISGAAPPCEPCAQTIALDDGDNLTVSTTAFSIDGLAPLVAPAPEPATWAFMAFGLGAMGWALRRQKVLLVA